MIRIITDSTCDIPQSAQKTLGIDIIPLLVHFPDGSSYRDGVDITPAQFYEKLAQQETLPTTSQLTPDVFIERLTPYVRAGDEIVGIFISSEMSGTYQSALVAREALGKTGLYIIDSRTVTFALGLLVHIAISLRDSGLSAAQIAERLIELTKKVRLLAVVDTLKYLKMGGRISGASAAIGTMLGIAPIIAIIDGKVESIGKAHGRKQGNKFIAEKMLADEPDLAYPLCFGHSNAPGALTECRESVSKRYDISTSISSDIGSAVGTHAGPGAAGVAYIAR